FLLLWIDCRGTCSFVSSRCCRSMRSSSASGFVRRQTTTLAKLAFWQRLFGRAYRSDPQPRTAIPLLSDAMDTFRRVLAQQHSDEHITDRKTHDHCFSIASCQQHLI